MNAMISTFDMRWNAILKNVDHGLTNFHYKINQCRDMSMSMATRYPYI